MPYFGAHESVSGGLHLAFERLEEVGGEALQIFSRNQRQWNPAPIKDEEREAFLQTWSRFKKVQVASHASYLVNLATGKDDLAEKSINGFTSELERCRLLSIPYVVMHPGSHGGDGIEVGLERFVKNLDIAIGKEEYEGMVLIETTAGQGTGLGSQFDEIGYILQNSKYGHRLGVCVDTCHVFAAGYDIRTPEVYQQTMDAFDREIGIDRLKFFHLNDTKNELGSRVDRHEHIGKGFIGGEGFRNLVNDPRFAEHPMTLETPKGKDLQEDRDNLAVLRGLLD